MWKQIFKVITRIYKMRVPKKCRYKGMIETAKHSRRELNIPEELERTRRNDAS
jgi:hypothetical protein